MKGFWMTDLKFDREGEEVYKAMARGLECHARERDYQGAIVASGTGSLKRVGFEGSAIE